MKKLLLIIAISFVLTSCEKEKVRNVTSSQSGPGINPLHK